MSTTTAILGLVKNADGDNARTALSTNLPANMDKLDAVLAGTDAYKIPNAALAQAYMTPIAGVLLAAPAASIDFSNIPQTYTTLMVVIRGRGTDAGAEWLGMRINGNADGAYDTQVLSAYGATVVGEEGIAATSAQIGVLASAGGVATGTGSIVVTLPIYSQAGLLQSWLATAGEVRAQAAGGLRVHTAFGSWRYTDPITQLTFTPSSGQLGIGTVATLYGLPS